MEMEKEVGNILFFVNSMRDNLDRDIERPLESKKWNALLAAFSNFLKACSGEGELI